MKHIYLVFLFLSLGLLSNAQEMDIGVPDGGSYNFGSINIGSNYDAIFTVSNAVGSTAALTITTPITVTGTGFSCTSQPSTSVASNGGTTTFTIRFAPVTPAGVKTGTVSITNNDPNENPYNFDLTGTAVGTPTVTTSGSLSAFTTCSGTASAEQSFTVSGSNLTANIVVTPPTGFEVSTTSGSGFASSVTLTQSSGSVSTTTIYTRLTSSASGTPSGNITCASTGATTQNVAASGTVNGLPTITLGSNPSVCNGTTSANLTYSATTNSPNQYSIAWSAGAIIAGFANITNASLPASPLTLTVPSNPGAGTYSGTLTVKNTTTNCVSTGSVISVTVNALPTVTLGSNPSICNGTTSANLTYSATTSSPNQYNISWSAGAIIAGFTNLSNTSLPASPITLTAPSNPGAGTYSGTLRVVNSTTGCSSTGNTMAVTVNALPTVTLGSNPSICNGTTSANLTYSATTSSPNQYNISWSAGAIIAGFTNLSNTSLPASPITLTAPSNPGAGTYSGTLRVVNSTTGCSSTGNTMAVTVNALPTVTLGSNPSICNGTTSTNLTYSATTSSPNQYNISWSAGAIIAGFTNLSNTSLPASPITLTAPSNPGAGTYSGTLRVVNSTTGCSSTGNTMAVTVNALPTVTLGSVTDVNTSATSFSLPYSATSGSPNQYSITTGSPTAMPSFSAVTNASLPASPIGVTIPASAANTYNFVATVRNSTTGCTSANNNFSLTVVAAGTTISSIVKGTPSGAITNANSVTYNITFGASITGLSASNFSLTTSGVSGASIGTLSGSGTNYTLTVNTGTGSGSITLNLDNAAGVSPGISTTLPFAGETYTIDKTLPTVVTQNFTLYLLATGFGTATAAQVNNGSSDASGIASLAINTTNFSCATIGANTVTLTVTDNAGNINTGTATITVLDTVRPVAVTRNRTVYLNAAGTGTVTPGQVNNGSTDACGVAAFSLSQTSFTCANVGTPVTVTFTVTDVSGNTGTGTATVTVLDTVRPVVVTQNRTVYLDATGTASLSAGQVNNGSTDACGVAALNLSQTNFTCANVGTPVTVTLTVTDVNSNTNTGTATITVLDTVRPVAVTRNRTVYLNAAGTGTVTPGQVNNGSTDACGVAAFSLSQTSFTCANVGTPVTVTFTVTDVSGNTGTGTATVTVLDTVRPVVVTQNRTVYLSAAGTATVSALQLNNGTSDACGVASLSASQTSYTCANVGTPVTVTLTATDLNGNTNTGTATVTVLDTVRPVVVTQNRTVYLSAAGTATVSALQLNNGTSDACGVASLSASQTSYTCANVGTPVTVTLTATDLNGNTNTGTATVTVLDTVRPVVVTQNRTVYLSAAGTATVSALQLNNGTSDACGVASLSASQTSYTCANVGTPVTVTLTATDLNGNTNTGTATVTVLDTVRPVVVTQNRTVYLSAAGTATVSALQLNNGTSDACGVASLSASQTSYTCANVGTPVTVTLTATDLNGNTNTGTATVTVLDTVRPVVVTQNRTVYLSAAGTATVSALQLNNGTSDACGVASLSASQTSYTCANVGTPVTVTLTATDLNGNTNTGTATVTVLDTVRPVVVTQNRTVYLSAAGTATVSALQLNNGTSDACGVASLSASQTSYTCANVGTPVTVTLTATDLNGNTNTGTATVTVLDTVRPVVVTQNRTVYLNAAGTASLSAGQVNNGSTDACGVAALNLSQTSFTCANVGTPVTVTLTVTDVNSNSNTGTATVTVLDTVRPVAVTRNRTVYLNAAGTGTVTPGQVNNGSTDACGVAAFSLSQTSFTCANVGTPVTVTFTVTDVSGNTNTGTATVTVLDTVRPIVNTQNRTVYLSAAGTATVSALQLNNGTTDACGVASLSASQTSYTCANVGTPVTVTLTATDLNGNTNTGTATVTVLDTVRPVVVTQNRTVYLSAAGTATVSALQLNNGTTDACGVASLSASQTSYTCANVGTPVTVTLTATDLNGNTNTGTATVTVLDTVRPIVNTQNRTVYLSAAGTATVSALQLNNGTTDACGVASLSASQTSYTCANVGTPVTVTLTATDLNGNTNTGTATVTVLDTVRPVVVTQNRTITLNDAGTATISAGQINNGSTDACGVAALSLSQTSFTSANIGANNVILTVTDVNGNSQTGTATVTVNGSPNANLSNLVLSSGTLTPTFDSTVISYTASVGNPTSSITVTPTKVQAGATIEVRVNGGTYATVTSGSPSGSLALNVGSNTIDVMVTAQDATTIKTYTVTVTRAAGTTINSITRGTPSGTKTNANSVTYNITFGASVTGLSASNFSLTTSGVSGASIGTLSGSGSSYSLTVNTGTGSGSITLNLDNATGLSLPITTTLPFAGETYTIDRTNPTVVTQNRTVYLSAAGTATVSAAQVNNGSNDASGIASLGLSQTNFTCANVGTPVTVTLTVTDSIGNTNTGTATVTVLDTVRPVVVTQNRTVYLSAAGTATVSALQLNNGTSDACGVASLASSQTSFTCANVGTPVTVTLTATDLNGNTNTGTATVTVLDTVRPVVVTQNRTVYLNAAGTASLSAGHVNNGSTDACGVAALNLSQTSFTCANVGTPVTVTLTVTDVNSNSNTGTATVTVLDTVRPVVVTQNRTVYLSAAGTATVSALQLNNGTSDACGVASLAASQTSYTCANVGTPVTVTLTATDLNGNTNTGTATVTVLDTVRPVVVTQNRTVYLSAAGTATVSALQLNNGTSDACGVASLSASQTSYTCANVGTPVTVTLTATDLNGNTNTGTATVTVLDTVRPVVVTQNRTVYLSAAGTATVSALQLNNGTSDACGVASLAASQTSYTCANVGTPVTVTLTATDLNGNTNTGTATVTVLDTVRPVVVTQNRTVYLSAAGTATVSALQLNNGTSDACGVASLSASQTSYTCANVGTPVTVTLTATDLNGNTNTGTATVTVLDTVRPVVVTQNRTVYLNAAGTASLSAGQLNNGSTDACGVAALNLSQTSFTCANVGTPVTVTLTVTDVNSNSNTGTATVTVLDTVRPVVVTQNRTVYLSAAGTATVSALQLNNGTSDACGVASLSASQTSYTCANVGTPVTVTLTATDLNGNTNTGTATVTVLDTVRPVVVTQNRTVYLSAAGTATVSALQLNNGTSDACGVASLSASQTSYTCANVGTPVTVTLTATDLNGNTNTGTATVTVLDTVRPVVVTQNRTVYLSAAGTATVSALQLNNGTSDACGVASLSASQTSYTCANVGTPVTVTLTATDLNGNTNTGTATVTVLDTVRPVVVTQNRTVYLSAAGTATVSALQLNNGTSDACGVASLSASQTSYTCANVGTPVTVTLTATDLNGNTNTGTATVTVLDTVRPVVNTQNRTVYLNAAGTASLSAGQVNNGSTDACGVAALNLSQTSFTCANVGTPVTVTLTVTDVNSNSNTGTATVTVLDTVRPVVVTQNRTVYLSAAGTATVSALQLNNGTSDACGVASLSASQTSYTCANVGTPVTVTLTATDLNGNTNTGTATVTVLDTVRPVVVTQNRTVYLSAAGTATVSALQLNNGTSDACGVASLSASQTSYTCANVGTPVTVTLTATDLNGNTNTGTATVTVLDTVRPVVVTQNRTVYLSAAGTATVSALQLNNGTSDACGVASLSASQTSYTCANVGTPVTVTLTATDLNGNTNTGTATVTVLDTVRPVVVTQNRTVYLSAAGTATVSALQLNNGTSDACGVASLSASQTSYTCANVGTPVTVTLTATDLNGNTNTGTATVTVLDTVRPVVVTQNRTIYLNAAGTATVSAAQVNNGSSDACGVAALSLSQTSFTCANVGTPVTVTLTVTDVNSNSNTGTATITVLDTIKPIIVCKADTAILTINGTVTITADSVTASSSDNCNIASASLSKTTFNTANVGNNSVTLTITDGSGNISTCVTNVFVIEPKPNAICQNATIYLNASGTATLNVNQIDNGSNSMVGIATRTLSKTAYDCTNLGTNTVKLTVTNTFNASDSCTATVTVLDTIKPTVIAQNRTIYLNTSGNATITAGQINNGSTDNCNVASISASKTSFDCTNVGANTVWLSVTDGSGNIDSTSATVTVLDTIKPVVTAQSRTIYLNASGTASVTVATLNTGSIDNCVIDSITASKTSFTCANLGVNQVWLRVKDKSGNVDSASVNVIVLDPIAPVARPKAKVIVYLSNNGQAVINPSLIDSASTDNCTITSRILSQTVFSCAQIGNNTITFTVQDQSGNSTFANSIVEVRDTIKPNVIVSNQTLYLNASGTATLAASLANNNSTDNCGIDSVWLSKTSFNCSDIGNNNVNLFVRDVNGNTNFANVVVALFDTIRPVLRTKQNITLFLNASGNATLTTAMVDSNSSDNCTLGTLVLSKTSFNCSNTGNNTVTLSSTDGSNNSSNVNFNVLVRDTTKPTLTTSNFTVYLNAAGTATLTSTNVVSSSADNCGTPTLSLNKTSFNCSERGNNNVTVTATDASGNFVTASAVVTVLDSIRPVPVAQNLTIYLNASGNASITAAQANNGSTDNCGITSLSLNNTTFNGTNLGLNTVTLTATDASSNSNSVNFTVTVLDTVRPVVVIQNVTAYLNTSGSVTITPAQVNNGSSDNVGVSSVSLSKPTFTCSDLGSNAVVLSVTDASNNTTTGVATVTILDTIRPIAVAQNITVYLNGIGQATVTPAQVNNGSSDNCGVSSTSLSRTTFSCANTGANTVTLTATDASGNSSNTLITITVLDTTKPNVVVNNNLNLYLNTSGTVGLTTTQVNNGSSDNCTITGFVLSKTTFNGTNLGLNQVNFTATDASNNSQTVTINVTIIDTIRPIVETQNKIVYLNNTGQASVTTSDINNGSTDNVAVSNIRLDRNTFNCGNLGINTIRLSVEDLSGNIGNGNAQVTVLDTISPKLLSQPGNLVFGKCGSTVNFGQPSFTDNCSVASVVQIAGIPNGGVYPVGVTTNTFRATDGSGNSITTSFTVTILPSYLPLTFVNLAMCSNASTVDLSQGRDSLTFSGSGVLNDQTTFDPSLSGAGTHLIDFIYTDSNGCNTPGFFTITVYAAPDKPIVDRTTSNTLKVRDAAANYQWYRNYLPMAGETNQTLVVRQSGVYTVEVRNNKGCVSVSDATNIGVPVGLGQINNQLSFKVYPNPSNGVFVIEKNSTAKRSTTIIITDVVGKEVMRTITEDDIIQLSLTELAAGTYYLRLENGEAVSIKPIVIKN